MLSSKTVNISSYISNYKSLTKDNIFFCDYNENGVIFATTNALVIPRITYVQTTGDVTVKILNANLNDNRSFLLIIVEDINVIDAG